MKQAESLDKTVAVQLFPHTDDPLASLSVEIVIRSPIFEDDFRAIAWRVCLLAVPHKRLFLESHSSLYQTLCCIVTVLHVISLISELAFG